MLNDEMFTAPHVELHADPGPDEVEPEVFETAGPEAAVTEPDRSGATQEAVPTNDVKSAPDDRLWSHLDLTSAEPVLELDGSILAAAYRAFTENASTSNGHPEEGNGHRPLTETGSLLDLWPGEPRDLAERPPRVVTPLEFQWAGEDERHYVRAEPPNRLFHPIRSYRRYRHYRKYPWRRSGA